MSRKDYICLADAIRRALRGRQSVPQVQVIIDEIALALKRDNQQFNRQKFINYINKP